MPRQRKPEGARNEDFGGSLHAWLFRCCRNFIKQAPLRSGRFLRRRALRFYEDQPERGPGPALGDYLGLPINAARPQACGHLVGLAEHSARMTVPTASGRLYLARPFHLTITKEIDSVSPRNHCFSRGMGAVSGPPRLPR
jgi:hypothetical protein